MRETGRGSSVVGLLQNLLSAGSPVAGGRATAKAGLGFGNETLDTILNTGGGFAGQALGSYFGGPIGGKIGGTLGPYAAGANHYALAGRAGKVPQGFALGGFTGTPIAGALTSLVQSKLGSKNDPWWKRELIGMGTGSPIGTGMALKFLQDLFGD